MTICGPAPHDKAPTADCSAKSISSFTCISQLNQRVDNIAPIGFTAAYSAARRVFFVQLHTSHVEPNIKTSKQTLNFHASSQLPLDSRYTACDCCVRRLDRDCVSSPACSLHSCFTLVCVRKLWLTFRQFRSISSSFPLIVLENDCSSSPLLSPVCKH